MPSLTEDDFKRISFVGRCEQNQWSTTKEGKLELMLSAEPGEACEARLHFREPQPLKNFSGLQFLVRSSRPRQRMAIELVGNTSGDPEDSLARTRPFQITDEWAPDAMRFHHLRKGWQPTAISEIRFIALSESGRSAPALFVKGVRFVSAFKGGSEPAADSNEIVSPVAADIPLDRQLVCVAANELPGLQSPPPGTPGVENVSVKQAVHALLDPLRHLGTPRLWIGMIAIGWLLFALRLIRRGRTGSSHALSPLYELNARTWKSDRDEEGIIRLGGVSSISQGDFKAMKAAGFNSVWIMGIWEVGPRVRAISKRYGEDYVGSPFAIYDYRISEDMGTQKDFIEMVDRAHAAGLKVIVDFVPNHMGLDSAWLNDHPEYFLHKVLDNVEAQLSEAELEKRYPGHFVYRTPSYPQGNARLPKTIMVAYGKDPYFYPWIDTAQLNYAEPSLRRRMTELLCDLAGMVDGVRCDMAMLVLREQVKLHRHPDMSWETFNRLMPEEFWTEAIRATKRKKPSFIFVAETYWAMEGYLQQLGFDYTYNKPLYEAICGAFHSGNAEGLQNFLRLLGTDFLSRGVHFLENHDEERAYNILGEDRQRGAAALLCTLPGISLIHQGQMEGKRERLPVQRAVPLHDEPVNLALSKFYQGLLRITSHAVFKEGRMNVLYSNNASLVSYARLLGDEKAIVIINTSMHFQKGSIFLAAGMRLQHGGPYELVDLYYDLKSDAIRQKPTVRPSYLYSAPQLVNQGLYVELEPFDAHIFLVESMAGDRMLQKIVKSIQTFKEPLRFPRWQRRLAHPGSLVEPTEQHAK